MLSRLNSAAITDVYTTPNEDLEYSSLVYDDAGNLTSFTYNKGSGNQNLSYTFSGDLLTGDGTRTINWDLNGRQKNRIDTVPANYALEYDWDGRLRKALAGPADEHITTTSTPDGVRVAKSRNFGDADDYNHKYVVDTAGKLPNVLLVLDADAGNAILKTNIFANGQILMQHNGDYSGDKYFYLHDRLGSVRQVMDPADTSIVNCYTYDPWGLTVGAESVETLLNPYRFAGYFFDSEIEQYYCNARMYDPVLGRFTGRDPVKGGFREPLTLHAYLYCLNDPVNHTDPSGQFTTTQVLVGVTIGVVVTGMVVEYETHFFSRCYNTLRLMAKSEAMDPRQVAAAVEAIERYWGDNQQMTNLKMLLEEGILIPRVLPSGTDIGGIYFGHQLYISEDIVNFSSIATALGIFAEWQHDQILGGNLNEEEADIQLQEIIVTLPPDEQQFFEGVHHGW
jgi:RHS repeat-associated protein